MTAYCRNEACTEYDLPKTVGITLEPGEAVKCGGCRQPCELVEGE